MKFLCWIFYADFTKGFDTIENFVLSSWTLKQTVGILCKCLMLGCYPTVMFDLGGYFFQQGAANDVHCVP